MGITLEPYLNFNEGQCENALNFYQAALGGELHIMRYSDAPMPCDDAYKNLVMHGHLKSDRVHVMASDSRPECSATIGNNISLFLNFTDGAEQTKIFEALAQGGTVTMPLDDVFWGARFGTLTDKFGVHWMLNHMKNP